MDNNKQYDVIDNNYINNTDMDMLHIIYEKIHILLKDTSIKNAFCPDNNKVTKYYVLSGHNIIDSYCLSIFLSIKLYISVISEKIEKINI